jgi:hypothetical protein
MVIVKCKEELDDTIFPDRIIYKAVGKEGPIISGKMSVGYGYYSSDIGMMEPHQHAEESIYIAEATKAYFRYGDAKDNLGEKIQLKAGMLIHFDELEWHVFECDDGGFLTIIFIYGQVDRIRPEEINI